MNANNTKCDAIIVTFNSDQDIARCINTLMAHNREALSSVIVIDNKSKDRTLEIVNGLATVYEKLKIISNCHNVGFAKANNIAARESQSPVLAFINPDMEFIDNSLITMINLLIAESNLGAVGPALFNSDGTLQQGYGKKITPIDIMIEFLLGWRIKSKIKRIFSNNSPKIDWISGACLLAKRDAFFSVGGFDENIFMYSEDLDLCLQLKKNGFNIVYESTSKAIHHSGGSQKSWKKWALVANIKSRLYYSRKYYGLTWGRLLWIFFLFYATSRIILHFFGSAFSLRHKEYFSLYLGIVPELFNKDIFSSTSVGEG
jgi:GT2 family glycosyltransferase